MTQTIVYGQREVQQLKDIIGEIISKYETQSGEYLGSFYYFMDDEVTNVEQLNKLIK